MPVHGGLVRRSFEPVEERRRADCYIKLEKARSAYGGVVKGRKGGLLVKIPKKESKTKGACTEHRKVRGVEKYHTSGGLSASNQGWFGQKHD